MKIKVSTILVLVTLVLGIAGFVMAFTDPFTGNAIYQGPYVLSFSDVYFSNGIVKTYLPGFIAFVMILISGLIPLLLFVLQDKAVRIFVNIASIIFFAIGGVVVLDIPNQFIYHIQTAAGTATLVQFGLKLSPTLLIASIFAFIGIALNLAMIIIDNLDFIKTKLKLNK